MSMAFHTLADHHDGVEDLSFGVLFSMKDIRQDNVITISVEIFLCD